MLYMGNCILTLMAASMDIVMTTRMVLNVPVMLVRNEAMAKIG